MLSILIVNWNTKELLRKCLQSIDNYPPSIPYETIVVDNASHDGSFDMVEAEFPQVVAIQSGFNSGYARGNNIAFTVAKGDWLLTLNPDTEFFDKTLQKSIEELSKNPEWGVMGIRLIGPDGETQNSVRGFPTPLGILGQLSGLDRRYPLSKFGAYTLPNFDYHSRGFAPQPMGTFLLFRRLSLASVADPRSPFDEQFPIFFNEVDLLKRLADAGVHCGYSGDCAIFHHHGAGTKQVRKSMIWESHRSLLRYFQKHLQGAQRLWLPAIAVAVTVGAFIRAKGYHAGFRPEHHNL